MAIFSSHAQVISRGKGRSAVAAAAYRAGEKIKNEWDGKIHDYSHKQGVVYAEIFTPDNVPDWMHDRSTLWNTIEQIEKRKDAQLAREIRVALPQELTLQQNIQLINDYARQFVREGMIADVAVHYNPDKNQDKNMHSHIMLTLRKLEGETFGNKNREWNKSENVEKWRERLATLTNEYLERYGHKDRVDPRSYEEQGIDRKPTIHLGKTAHQLEQKGKLTDRGNINRAIDAENAYRDKAKQAIELIDKAIREEQERMRRRDRERIENEKQSIHHTHDKEQEHKRELEYPLSYREQYNKSREQRLIRDPDRQSRSYSNPYKEAQKREKIRQDREKEGKARPPNQNKPPPERQTETLDDILHKAERQVTEQRQFNLEKDIDRHR